MNDRTKRILWLVARLLLMAGLIFYVLRGIDLHDRVRPMPDAAPEPILAEGPNLEKGLADGDLLALDPDGGTRVVPAGELESGYAVRVAGMLSIGRRLADSWGYALAALVVMMLQTPVGAIRWRMLLAVQGIHITLWESVRLTYIGWFFNNWLPGATGGDFLKAYYIAQQTHHKAEAVTTVFLDRLIGLVAMCMLGAAAVAVCYHDPSVRPAKYAITAFLLGVCGGAVVFYSHRLRAFLRLRYLKPFLPMRGTLERVDSALFIYRYHKATVLISVAYSWLTQVVSVLTVWWLATGLGSHAAWYQYFVTMPVVWIVWSLIPVPGGFGVAEVMMKVLLSAAVLGVPGKDAQTLAVAIIFAYRIIQIVVSSPGGVLYWMSRTNISTSEMRQEMANQE
jgi:glycosyltransferase 2 family protein